MSQDAGPSWKLVAASSAISGAAMAAVAMHLVATRGKSSSLTTATTIMSQYEQMLQRSLRQQQQEVVAQVHQGLSSQFQKSIQSQELVIQKSLLAPVAAAQQSLVGIHKDVTKIKDIFHSPKTRGDFGELQLQTLIQDSMSSPKLYDFQYTLSNKKRVDCLLHLPSPIGKLAVDSKFPLDSFQKLLNNDTEQDTKVVTQKVHDCLHKHIQDIASKYIIPGETADYAILFLPSEALFLQIVHDFPEILSHANRRRVYLTCPTTLLALLQQLHGASRGLAMQDQTEAMLSRVRSMAQDVDRLVQRFEQTEKSLEKAKSELGKMQTSIGKVRRHKAELDAMGGFVEAVKVKLSTTVPEKVIPPPDVEERAEETATNLVATGLSGLNGKESATQTSKNGLNPLDAEASMKMDQAM